MIPWKSWKYAKILIITWFLVLMPLVQTLGALYATSNQAVSLNEYLNKYLFAGNLWGTLTIVLCLMMGSFMANIGNIYSAGICLNTFIPHSSFNACVFAGGVIGILWACTGTSQYMYVLLEVMGVVMASISVGTIAWWLAGPPSIVLTLISWILGICIGVSSLAGILTITTYASLDAALVSGVVYCLLNILSKHNAISDYQR
jgi:hypothetical protein